MKDKFHLVVVEPNNSGGLVHFAYQMCNGLAKEDVDVTLITGTEYEMVNQPHSFHVEKMLRLWKHFDPGSMKSNRSNLLKRVWRKFYWNSRRLVRGGYLVLAWVHLTQFLLDTKPDIVQFTRIEFPFEALFIHYLRYRGLTLTQICHEFEKREKPNHFVSSLEYINRDLYTNFSVIFFLSEKVRNRFLKSYPSIPESKTSVIPHGNSSWLLNIPALPESNLRNRYGLKKQERVVLFFGLLSPSKGLEDLLDAFAIAHKSVNTKLVIAGYPTKHINLEGLVERANDLKISDHLIFDPRYIPLNEIQSLMKIACVVVYPYRSGTQSGALQTAYTFERPVIATDVGGLPEAVENGKSGFVVPPQNPIALAEKIVTLAENPVLAKEMGVYAHHLSETKYGWQPIARQIKFTYQQIIKTQRNN